ncbi:hypothetical protein HLI01_19120 [Rhizobium laguerreae]|uniref:hypothetical protein n=1 Tax=Rhizobium laguerreae TaxID=1076926 RepID=UPI00147907BB|nr:hypothetical protein [Rhizobium laguerreae]NNH58869.1 hypothetical protein [Rhizobium laguerreae]
MRVIEFDPEALSGLLPEELGLYVHALDTEYIDLLSQPRVDPADADALAVHLVALYDEIAGGRPEWKTGPESPVCKNGDILKGRTVRPTTTAG